MLEQRRSTQRKKPCVAVDEPALTKNIIALARKYGRYGYRRVKALRRSAGWTVNRVARTPEAAKVAKALKLCKPTRAGRIETSPR